MIYSIDVIIYATAYIRADSPEEALEEAKANKNSDFDDFEICGLSLDDPDLPDFSLSPAMTYYGPGPDDFAEEY